MPEPSALPVPLPHFSSDSAYGSENHNPVPADPEVPPEVWLLLSDSCADTVPAFLFPLLPAKEAVPSAFPLLFLSS